MSDNTSQMGSREDRISIEVQRHNGAWSDAESAFVRPDEDPSIKVLTMSARLQWYRETTDFTYRLVRRTEMRMIETEVLTEVAIEVPDFDISDID